MSSIVDVGGLNKNAVLAIVSMVNLRGSLKADTSEAKPLIAALMFGVTIPCVDRTKDYLEQRGYKALVFHATRQDYGRAHQRGILCGRARFDYERMG